MDRRTETNSGRRFATILVASSLVIAGLVAGFVTARSAATASDATAGELAAEATALDLADIRATVVRTSLDDAAERFGVAAGVRTSADLETAGAARSAAWADAVARLGVLAERSDQSGEIASEILEVLVEVDQLGEPFLIDDLYWVAGTAQWPAGLTEREDPLVREGAFVDQLFSSVRTETLVATIDLDGIDGIGIEPDDQQYIEDEIDYVRDVPGWLGDNADDPLADAWIGSELESDAVADRLSAVVTSSNLWVMDQWVKAWAEGAPDPPPVGIVDYWIETDQSISTLRLAADENLAMQAEAITSELADAQSRADTMNLLSVIAAVTALITLLATLATAVRHHRATSALGSIDPLTGVQNRRGLDRVGRLLERPLHHEVIVIDLDRFKMVNDTYGHAAGDRVLVEIARRLQTAAHAMAVSHHEVVRLGGDEFLVSLHDESPIDPESIAARLEHITTCRLEMQDGDDVALAFSFGRAGGRGPLELGDVVDAADLAAYEAKNARRGQSMGEGAPNRMHVRN